MFSPKVRQSAMNHSFYSADRMTHLKIVVVALVAAIGRGRRHFRARRPVTATRRHPARSKASKTVISASTDQRVIR